MSETVTSGNTAAYIVNVEALNGFTGVVNLSLPGGPDVPLLFDMESVVPSSVKGSGSAIITIHTTANSYSESGAELITGTSGALSHATYLSTTSLASPDFMLIAQGYDQSVTAGGSATYALEIIEVSGFTGNVNLSVSGLPAGATASFSPASLYSSGFSTLTIRTTAMTPTGSFSPIVTATSGVLTHTAGLSLEVGSTPDFSLSAGPGSQIVTGSTVKYLVGVSALSGFTGSVSLAVSGLPANATASFSPPTLSGSAISVLTITTNGAIPSGATTLTITGSSGNLSHTATVTLVSGTAPDFSISVGPLEEFEPFGGGTCPVLIESLNGFKGTVNLSASGLPAGATVSFTPSSVTAFPGGSTVLISYAAPPGTTAGTATITITGTSGSLSHSVPLTFNTIPGEDFTVDCRAEFRNWLLSAPMRSFPSL